MLIAHRKQQLEFRMRLGLGKPDSDALVFCDDEGNPVLPGTLSHLWKRVVSRIPGVPRVTFHALRHTHASALIAGGLDVVSVSRRLGHSGPTIMLSVYAHLFETKDEAAAEAIAKVLG
jgi:integrase